MMVVLSTRPAPPRTAQQVKDDRNESLRVRSAIEAVHELKASLRNPDSFALEKVLTNEDGGVICIRYRAQNGFGGMNRALFVATDQSTSSSSRAWDRRCAHRSLYNYTDTLPEVMKLSGQ